MSNSECIYCGSHSYGTPCLFSPTNTHVHMNNGGKCIYCGSNQTGSGCLLNPYNKIHIRGQEFLSRAYIQTEKFSILSYLFNKLKFISLSENYKSPLDNFYKKIANLIASTAQPLLEALYLQNYNVKSDLSKEHLIESFKLQQDLKKQFKITNELIKKANLNLPSELVEESIVSAIMSIDED